MMRPVVIIPAHNRRETTLACLERLAANGDFGDFEVSVIDDGSTDGTASLLQEMAAADARVRPAFIARGGIVSALQAGLPLCRGRYVARMDADDVSHPRRLALQAALLEARPDLAVVSCRVCLFPRRLVRPGMLRYERWLNSLLDPHEIERDLYVESPLAHPSVMLRTEALRAVGGYRDTSWAEDYDLWLRLHAAGARFAKLDEALLFWAEHGERLTYTSGRYAPEQFRRCKLEHLAQGPLAGVRQVVIWGAGPTGKPLARTALELGLEVVAFVDLAPRKLGQRILGAPVISPAALGAWRGVPILVAVGRDGARDEIRATCLGLGLHELRDFWCLA